MTAKEIILIVVDGLERLINLLLGNYRKDYTEEVKRAKAEIQAQIDDMKRKHAEAVAREMEIFKNKKVEQ